MAISYKTYLSNEKVVNITWYNIIMDQEMIGQCPCHSVQLPLWKNQDKSLVKYLSMFAAEHKQSSQPDQAKAISRLTKAIQYAPIWFTYNFLFEVRKFNCFEP